ncbi:MAG: NAD(P)H-hydrate dehydratase [Oscillospiraceae bacterium]|nr:NAD(P)H-hydrate dehydratase [Oscillospiraceae bacterium]
MDITASFVKNVLPCRDPMGHKGTFGKVYGLCGAVGYTGAPCLAAEGAVRSGSGLVFLGVPESVWPIVAGKCLSAMPAPLPEKDGGVALAAESVICEKLVGMDAFLMGCGLGRNPETERLVRSLLNVELPLVLDADGINALQGHMDRLQRRRSLPTVLTPHAGEFARVGGESTLPRDEAAKKFAAEHGVVLVLKGPGTVVAAPDGRVMVNTTSNDGLAKGGSGDILSGMVLSLLGQGMDAFEAACAAVFIHGLAGDMAAREKGRRGMTLQDVLDMLPYAYKEIEG